MKHIQYPMKHVQYPNKTYETYIYTHETYGAGAMEYAGSTLLSLSIVLSLVIVHAQATTRCMHPMPSEAKCAAPRPTQNVLSRATCTHAERVAAHASMCCLAERTNAGPI
jgi:hypothetical protein